MKYSQTTVRNAYEWVKKNGLIDYGGGQLQDFCAYLGIDDMTYRRWLKGKDDFRQAIEKAKEEFKVGLTHDLHETLSMVAKGYEKEVTETEYRPNPKDPEKPTITKVKRKKVIFEPHVGAAIFLITNLDPEHYQNRQNSNIALRTKPEEKDMTLEEINAELERLEKMEGK